MGKIEEAQDILRAFEMPDGQQNEISALTLLALCGVKEHTPWNRATRQSMTLSKGIMAFVSQEYAREYAANTRETFRRQVLHQFLQAGIAELNPDDQTLPVNSPKTHYAISNAALKAIRTYATPEWNSKAAAFVASKDVLRQRHEKEREREMVSLIFRGKEFRLSPGEHNELQVAVVNEFAPRFAPGARLLYLGDTADKQMIVDKVVLREIGMPITLHSKLPDIILLDQKHDCVMLVEAAVSHGPMNDKRVRELNNLLEKCTLGRIYITAFPDFERFREHMNDLAWETEVWIATEPEHMIHFDGDRFLRAIGRD